MASKVPQHAHISVGLSTRDRAGRGPIGWPGADFDPFGSAKWQVEHLRLALSGVGCQRLQRRRRRGAHGSDWPRASTAGDAPSVRLTRLPYA